MQAIGELCPKRQVSISRIVVLPQSRVDVAGCDAGHTTIVGMAIGRGHKRLQAMIPSSVNSL